MNILIDINHPSQVHLFKNAIWEWEKHGHSVLVVARDKDVTLELLDEYGIMHAAGTRRRPGLLNLLVELFTKTFLIWRIGRRFRPNVVASLGSPPAAWAAALLRVPHLAFTDTEHSIEQFSLYAPFTRRIYTPDCFLRELGPKQRRYAGYHELAYLHPQRFTPDPHKLAAFGLSDGEEYFVIRLVSFSATHDINKRGLTTGEYESLVRLLSEYGKVVVSSESAGGLHIAGSDTLIPSDLMHDLLSGARLFIGEGTTMATEAALLGTPAITLTPHQGGNRRELEQVYGLMRSPDSPGQLEELVREMLSDPALKQKWQEKRARLLGDKIDVTEFMVNEIETFLQDQA